MDYRTIYNYLGRIADAAERIATALEKPEIVGSTHVYNYPASAGFTGYGDEKKSSDEWARLLGAEVMDPDGWDRTKFEESWMEPITKKEFDKRLEASTIDTRGYVPPRYGKES